MAHHNKLRDGVAYLASKAFIPTNVHDDPKIYTGRAVRGWKDKIKWPPSQDAVDNSGHRGQTVLMKCGS